MKDHFLLITGLLVVMTNAMPSCVAQDKRPTADATKTASQTVLGASKDEERPQLHSRYPRYRLQSGDVLDLTFRYTKEFNQKVTIQPDGFIQLKGLANDIHVEGLTVPELIETLQGAYAKSLHDPVISVTLADFEKPYFVAGGQVGHPGKFDLRGETTVTQAVQIAGGFTDYAKVSQILLFRRYSSDWMEVKVLNLKSMLKGKHLQEDTTLRPGDMLFVPKSTLGKIDRFLPRTSLGTYFSPSAL